MSKNALKGLEKLTYLEIYYTYLEELAKGLLKNLKYLKRLNLSNNKWHSIKLDILIEMLDISGNQLNTIEPYSFGKLKRLENLSLKGNSLKSIDLTTFA
jgi:Leucine-rich repeat (LRR) protein